MPLVSIICPHCEKSVQLQVTDVARSRACPSCGQSLMLQVAERSTGTKRKALLVTEPAADETPESFAQRQFEGHPFDRMRADPDLQRASRRLMVGMATVAALIVLTIAVSLLTGWNKRVEPAPSAAAEVVPAQAPLEKQDQHLPPMISRRLDFEEIVRQRKSELAKQEDQNAGE